MSERVRRFGFSDLRYLFLIGAVILFVLSAVAPQLDGNALWKWGLGAIAAGLLF